MKRIFKFWRNPYFQISFWVVVSALLLYLAVRDVNLQDVWQSIRQAQPVYILLALGSTALNLLGKAYRWKVLFKSDRHQVKIGKLLKSLMMGQTLNWFIPGRVGDLSRAYTAGGNGISRSYVLGTVALEKAIDMLSYALLFVITLLLLPLPAWLSDSGYTLVVVALVVLVGMFLLTKYSPWFLGQFKRFTFWLPQPLGSKIIRIFASGLSSLEILRQREAVLHISGLSIVIWGTAALTNYLTAVALGMEVPIIAALVVLVVLHAGVSIPAVPGRIGIFQYLCILALSLFGVDQASGFSFGILLQALVFLPTTLISLVFFSRLGTLEFSAAQVSEAGELS